MKLVLNFILNFQEKFHLCLKALKFSHLSLYSISMLTSLCFHKKALIGLCLQLFFQVYTHIYIYIYVYIYTPMCYTYIILIYFNLIINMFSALRLFAGKHHKITE